MRAPAVAIVRARYNPHGGAERYTRQAMDALAGAGVALTVIARRWPASAVGDGAPVRLLRVDPFHLGSVWRDQAFARGVRAVLARERFDLVQSHERIAGVPVYRAGDGVHASYLAARSRVLPAWRAALMRADPHHRWVLREERALFTSPALRAVICNSRAVLEDIAARFGVPRERLHLLRNGVDLERFRSPTGEERARARAALGLPEAVPVFAFVGSGFERKGLAVALAALARLGGDARLLVAGTDRRMARYRAQAAALGLGGRAVFLGGVDDVRGLLWASDAMLAPALYDPYPNAALEALACGLPLVASQACGVAELLEPGVNGFVHDALDVAGFAASLAQIAQAREGPRGAALRQAARAAAQAWPIQAAAEALLGLWQRLLAESRGS
ncbi:MAG: glycosyltransferase family 4 protein [Burkholderiales bacterium]